MGKSTIHSVSLASVQQEQDGMVHTVLGLLYAEEDRSLTISTNACVHLRHSSWTDTARHQTVMEGESGMEPTAHAQMDSTGMELSVSSALTVRFGTQEQNLVSASLVLHGMETTALSKFSAPTIESTAKNINNVSVPMATFGMEHNA